MDIRSKIEDSILKALTNLGFEDSKVDLDIPDIEHGDYSCSIALRLSGKTGDSPMEIASKTAELISSELTPITKVEVVKPGFMNFRIDQKKLLESLNTSADIRFGVKPKRIIVEYAHPNTHKEMHIGHMRTLITGEAISRILEAVGHKVFHANYQGDIGPHVAKAIYGVRKILIDKNLNLEEIEKWENTKKAELLGQAYALGSRDYEGSKDEIDKINNLLYQKDHTVWDLYETTRRWSLDYYDDFYKRFYTKFDRLFFESEMVEAGKKIVLDNIGKVFKEENGAVIFSGEEYGLHTRVFITNAGNPTYEGKEMGNGFAEYEAFPFDEKIHVVGSEQAGYFQVVFKALELIDPDRFAGKQQHVSMGMVSIVGMKMSSRTGEILRVDELISKIKEQITGLVDSGRINAADKDKVTEMVAIGAIKYSVLKVGTGQNVSFDIEKSISLEGDSGPYLQYTYARTQSVLDKSEVGSKTYEVNKNLQLEKEESDLIRFVYRYRDVVEKTARQYSPQILAEYLYNLARLYNNFYQKHKIIDSDNEILRLALTTATGQALREGLNLLGIKSPERM